MAPQLDAKDLPVGIFLILRDLIRDRIGIWFEDEKRELLAAKIIDRVLELGLQSYLDYFYLLKYDAAAEVEWLQLTEALSVQETYFWREFDQIRALVDVLVPAHVEAGRGPIRIWSAACATGEEPLTLAMALNEAGWFAKHDVQISASDVSPAALQKANAGVYTARSFRALPDALRDKYFVSTANGWQVAQDLHSHIRYSQANLLAPDETAGFARASFVFCRNVFIYFSTGTVARVVRHFVDHMPQPGYLFVGASESLLRIKSSLQLDEIGGAFVYVKK